MFGFYLSFSGRTAAWLVAGVFTILGAVIALYLPTLLATDADRARVTLLLEILGGVFFFSGAVLFAAMLYDWYLARRAPDRREDFFAWVNYLAGMFGAALFAVPATLMCPALLIYYARQRDAFAPANSGATWNNLIIGGIFTLAGIGALAMMYFVGKSNLPPRARRRQISR